MEKRKRLIFTVPDKWHEYITLPLRWVAWVVTVGVLIGFVIRLLSEPIRWGWVICERLIQ